MPFRCIYVGFKAKKNIKLETIKKLNKNAYRKIT